MQITKMMMHVDHRTERNDYLQWVSENDSHPKHSHQYIVSSFVGSPKGIKLRQSIFMPRWASRILLEVTDIRVERLNAISDADALAEGCSSDSMLSGDCLASVYARLWESINGEGSWKANPWVWVIGFRRVQL